MHRLTGHPEPARDLSNRRPSLNFQHHTITLLDHAQLHQHPMKCHPCIENTMSSNYRNQTRERQTHLRYLAEVLAAEVDDRTERRRTRRINDAKFPRLKRLAACE